MENIYKKAVLQNLVFPFGKRMCSVSQVAQLSLQQLNEMAKEINAVIQQQNISFLTLDQTLDTRVHALRLEIILDLIRTKEQAILDSQQKAKIQSQVTHLRNLIAQKKEESIQNMSQEALEAQLQTLLNQLQ